MKQLPLFFSSVRTYMILAMFTASLLGWLFPDALWSGDTVCITNEDGEEVTCEYEGEDIEAMVSGSNEIHYSWKAVELWKTYFDR